jgi:polysaccharide pyruvyl transferase WcaK-like protein
MIPHLIRTLARRFLPASIKRGLRKVVARETRLSSDDAARNVLVTGYYGYGNLGDDILASYVIKHLCNSIPTKRIAVDARCGCYLEQWFPGIKCMPAEQLFRHSPDVKRQIIFGGGGMFHAFPPADSETLWGLERAIVYQYRCRFGSASWSQSPKYAFCVGVGPIEGRGAKWITKELLREFEHISVRDRVSMCYLGQLGIEGVEEVSDPSISLVTSARSDDSETCPNDHIGIVIRAWRHVSITNLFATLHHAAQILRAKGYVVEFISFQDAEWDSSEANAILLLRQMNERVRVWSPRTETVLEFCDYLSQFRAIVTMRAHGIYLASILGVTPIAVTIEPKLLITAEKCGFADLLVATNNSAEEIAAKTIEGVGISRNRDWSMDMARLQVETMRLREWARSRLTESQ